MGHFIPTIVMKIKTFNFLFIVVKIKQKLLHCTLVHEGQRRLRGLIFRESGKYSRSQLDKMGTSSELRWSMNCIEGGSRERNLLTVLKCTGVKLGKLKFIWN